MNTKKMNIRTQLFMVLVIISAVANAQNKKQAMKVLKKIDSSGEIAKYKKKYPKWTIRTVSTLGIESEENKKVIHAEIGEIFEKEYKEIKAHVMFKVLGRRDVEVCKVKYIFFDGSKMPLNQIDSIRPIVIEQFKKGVNFTELVKKYTMDGNPTGDLQWFYKGVMVAEFEEAVMPKTKGEIFMVNVESRKWYYVVLKTRANMITTVTESVGISFVMQK